MISLELTEEDGNFLLEQLAIHRARVENELVHTDRHNLQHALQLDLNRLDNMRDVIAQKVIAASRPYGFDTRSRAI
jgi:hypothetical protein